jgi:hypothetical protein
MAMLLAALPANAAKQSVQQVQDRPNIIFILRDDPNVSRNASSRAQQHAAKVAAEKKREANK